MNKELQNLLEDMEDNTQDYVGTNGCLYQDLERDELNLILDCISNLQNQVKKQKEVIDRASARLECFLIGNLKYQSSQKEFIKLVNILKEGKNENRKL